MAVVRGAGPIVHQGREVAPLLLAACLFMAACAQGKEAAKPCVDLARLSLPRTEIVSGTFHAAGMVKDEDRPFPPTEVPAHCRVLGILRPAPGSEINFEVWLPAAGWNERLLGVGNGGYGGSMPRQGGLAEAVQRGYAAVSTDTGHAGTAIDTQWAYQNREKIIDWGHRAVHLMTRAAKSIVEARLGRPAAKAYFMSCSNGGRQGLMAAQRYPMDYDGIVVGAPAYDFTGLMTAFAWNYFVQNEAKASVIPPSLAGEISSAVDEQCDHLDGLRDGLISDPRRCSVDFSVLKCGDRSSDQCLSEAQLTALGKLYRGPETSSGERLYPGWPVGGESGTNAASGWEAWMLGAEPHQRFYVEGFYRHFLGRGEQWGIRQIDFDRDPAEAERQLAGIIDATSPDLGAFAENGGKLIIYHGWSDEAVPAGGTIEYVENVRRFMGAETVEGFLRLFLVPGMHHCFGGHGPSLFNNATAPRSPKDPSRDIGAALKSWVEDGIAPQSLIAVQTENPFEAVFDLAKAVPRRTGLLCPHPGVARLRGPDFDPTNASSYVCDGAR